MTIARPKIAFLSGLTPRQAITPVSALIVVIGLAWYFTVSEAAGLDSAMAGTMGMALVPFLVMWLPMVVAMMFPTVGASAVMAVRDERAGTATRTAAMTAVFLVSYLVVWMLFGLAVYLVLVGAAELYSVPAEGGKWLAAGIYAVAGIYQFTPAKSACRERCRSPKCAHAEEGATFGATVRVAVQHGLLCIGCCAAFMVVLITVGMANVVAMAVLTVVIFVERQVSRPALVSWIAGALLLLAAVLTPFVAWLHPGLPGPETAPMPEMPM